MRALLPILLSVIIIGGIIAGSKLTQQPTQYQSKADTISPHVIIDSQSIINQLHPYFSRMENGPGYYNSSIAQSVKNYGGLGALRIMTGSFAQSRFFFSYTGTNPSYKILAQDNTSFSPNTEYLVKLVSLNSQIQIWINNSKIFTITDPELNLTPTGCPSLLTTHDWNSTHYFKDLTYQRIDTNGNPQGSPVILNNADNGYYLIDESPSGDAKSGPVRRITLNGFGNCNTLGSNYSFTAIIKVNNNSQYGSGYLGLGLFGEKYNFLWNDGRDCQYTVQCGGLSYWNNRKLADELKMADELGTTPYFAITGRMSSQQLATFMSNLQTGSYNGKDYLTPALVNGLFLEIGDEEYNNDYKNNPQGYAQKINDYAQTVKNISPNIKIGYTAFFDNNFYAMGCVWDRTLLPLIIDSIDFLAISQYPCPNSNSQSFEGNSTTCLCSADPANRAPRCDEAWTGPAGGRFEKIRAYSKDALLKAGFSESSPQIQKTQNLPIVISGLNLEGTEGCNENLPPPRDTKKLVEFLGLTAEKGLTSIMPCCSLSESSSNYWALEPTSGYLKTLYFYRKHFGDSILNVQKDSSTKIYAAKNQNKLNIIISGTSGITYDLDLQNFQIDFTKEVKIFTPDILNTTPLRSFLISTPRFSYTAESDIVSLEIPLSTSCILKTQGDANCDGNINGIDLGILILYQCIKTNPSQVCFDLRADFNNNGQIDTKDRQTIISRL